MDLTLEILFLHKIINSTVIIQAVYLMLPLLQCLHSQGNFIKQFHFMFDFYRSSNAFMPVTGGGSSSSATRKMLLAKRKKRGI